MQLDKFEKYTDAELNMRYIATNKAVHQLPECEGKEIAKKLLQEYLDEADARGITIGKMDMKGNPIWSIWSE